MKSQNFLAISTAALALCASALFVPAAAAPVKTVIYSLPSGTNAYGRPAEDSNGALYGTGFNLDGSGAIFRLKESRGVWSSKILHDFHGSDGANPYAGLTEDHSTTTFYGTTEYGGSANQGAIFTLVPSGKQFVETNLHSLTGSEGSHPISLLTMDDATGALYGTTVDGGAYNCGTAFELSRSGGNWNYNLLYSFHGGNEGCNPSSQLRQGQKAGVLFGTTANGGFYRDGTVFRLTESHGIWSLKHIHVFTGTDGKQPTDFDVAADGTIYGVTYTGGGHTQGVAFQIVPNGKKWNYSVGYNFQGGRDGSNPVGIHAVDKIGAIYVTTEHGGNSDDGTVVQLTPSGGSWPETILHSFSGGADGFYPQSRNTVDRNTGYLYGTTLYGGAHNGGTVYQIIP